MQDDKHVESASIPAESSQPKKVWQKPRIQKLRISLDTAGSPGSATDGFGGSMPL